MARAPAPPPPALFKPRLFIPAPAANSNRRRVQHFGDVDALEQDDGVSLDAPVTPWLTRPASSKATSTTVRRPATNRAVPSFALRGMSDTSFAVRPVRPPPLLPSSADTNVTAKISSASSSTAPDLDEDDVVVPSRAASANMPQRPSDLWTERHRPRLVSQLSFHPQIDRHLTRLAARDDFPHVLFYGPAGSGKQTRMLCLLHALFGDGVRLIKSSVRTIPTGNKHGVSSISLQVSSSAHHVEINPSLVGPTLDRYVVHHFIHELSEIKPITSHLWSQSNPTPSTKTGGVADPAWRGMRPFKVLVIRDADRLSVDAQAALRRVLERSLRRHCRLILCCSDISRMISAFQSRCLCLRLSLPTTLAVCNHMSEIARSEKLSSLITKEYIYRLVEFSQRNMHDALLRLQSSQIEFDPNASPVRRDQRIHIPDWMRFLEHMARLLVLTPTWSILDVSRDQFYELLTHGISPTRIISMLCLLLCKRCDEECKHAIIRWAAIYQYRMVGGAHPITHLQAFTCKFLALYTAWLRYRF